MNEALKQRILRRLETLGDERGYQILDYVEFLESKYAARANPTNIFAKMTETVGDVMRAGKLPVKAISGTMGLMDSASKVMKGVAAAAQAVVDEAIDATREHRQIDPTRFRAQGRRGGQSLTDFRSRPRSGRLGRICCILVSQIPAGLRVIEEPFSGPIGGTLPISMAGRIALRHPTCLDAERCRWETRRTSIPVLCPLQT
jgi:hypothetical protein